MAKLSADEQKMLAELSAKRDAPDDDDDRSGFDGDVIVLRGARAEDLVSRLFGGGGKPKSEGNPAPAAKPKKGAPAAPPADADADEDQGDEDGDEDEPDVDDPPAQPGHRYFGGSRK